MSSSSHAIVIQAFGGLTPLAKAIGVDRKLVVHWPRRGIPAKYWPKVQAAAARRGLMITAHNLAALSPFEGVA